MSLLEYGESWDQLVALCIIVACVLYLVTSRVWGRRRSHRSAIFGAADPYRAMGMRARQNGRQVRS
jgi:hypothetical protein